MALTQRQEQLFMGWMNKHLPLIFRKKVLRILDIILPDLSRELWEVPIGEIVVWYIVGRKNGRIK